MASRLFLEDGVSYLLFENADLVRLEQNFFDDIRQDLLNGIDSAQAEGTGWDALRSGIPVTAVVRSSNTVVTITVPALATYDITADETITVTVPAVAVVGAAPMVATPTIGVLASTGASGELAQTLGALVLVSDGAVDIVGQAVPTLAAVTMVASSTVDVAGTATATLGALTVAGVGVVGDVEISGDLTYTLASLTLTAPGGVEIAGVSSVTLGTLAIVATGTVEGAFDATRRAILDGIDSAQAEATGWDALRSTIPVTAVVRTSATVVTITLPALPTYNTTAHETLTITVPGAALTGAVPLVATPTFQIAADLGVFADLTQTLASLGFGGAGTVDVVGQVVQALDPVTTAAIGTVDVAGTAAATLDAVSLQSDGIVGDIPLQGTLSQTLEALIGLGTGTVTAVAVPFVYAQWRLPPSRLRVPWVRRPFYAYYALDDSVGATGELTQTLAAVTLSAPGAVTVVGDVAHTLEPLSLFSTTTVDVAGQTTAALDPVTLATLGTVDVAGVATATLGALSLQSDGIVGSVPDEGTLTQTLGPLTVVGTGAVEAVGVLVGALEPASLVSDVSVDVSGQAVILLAELTLVATSAQAVEGTLTVTLAALTLVGPGIGGLPLPVGPSIPEYRVMVPADDVVVLVPADDYQVAA